MTRSAEQNQRMRDERREQILSGALRLFVSKGLAATRSADIAREAGVSQGLLYHYFASKEAIYTELIRAAFERLNAAALALEASPLPPGEKIARALAELLRGFDAGEDAARTFILTAQASLFESVPAGAAAVVREQRDVPYQAVARILAAGQRDGSVRPGDPDALAVVFWATIKGLAMHRAAFGPGAPRPDPGLLARFFLTEDPR